MIIDTHTHVVSSDRNAHPLHPDATGWSLEVSNNVEDLIREMDSAGVECATLVQPNGTYGLDNTYQCDSAKLYSLRALFRSEYSTRLPPMTPPTSFPTGSMSTAYEGSPPPEPGRTRRPAVATPFGPVPKVPQHPHLHRRRGDPRQGQPDAEHRGEASQRPLCPRSLCRLERRRGQGWP